MVEQTPYGCDASTIQKSSRYALHWYQRGQVLTCEQGSVFVEFDDMSAVDRFLKAEPKPTWEGKELLIMTKSVYSFHL